MRSCAALATNLMRERIAGRAAATSLSAPAAPWDGTISRLPMVGWRALHTAPLFDPDVEVSKTVLALVVSVCLFLLLLLLAPFCCFPV